MGYAVKLQKGDKEKPLGLYTLQRDDWPSKLSISKISGYYTYLITDNLDNNYDSFTGAELLCKTSTYARHNSQIYRHAEGYDAITINSIYQGYILYTERELYDFVKVTTNPFVIPSDICIVFKYGTFGNNPYGIMQKTLFPFPAIDNPGRCITGDRIEISSSQCSMFIIKGHKGETATFENGTNMGVNYMYYCSMEDN